MRKLLSRLLVIVAACVATGTACVGTGTAQAQILIWSLPEDEGAWVRFEGNYKQTQSRPQSNAGDEMLGWRSELSISSVGRTMAEFEGAEVPCRWVEFKTVTKVDDLEKPAGPGGTYLYKVLIPESKVIGEPNDPEGIAVTFLPIVKGYRKVGAREVETVSEQALGVYPTIAPVTYYPDLKQDLAEPAELSLLLATEPIATRAFKGSRTLQNNLTRSINSAVLWRSDAVPFGLAKFQVTLTREEKGLSASADEFKRRSLVEIDMSAIKQGVGAKSELPESN
ncbi:MAG: hypothetical protein EXS05_06390 [Planctomycetaceae bacterium]|nr:hypothetical protein [Planctomycetaceae bacterium]